MTSSPPPEPQSSRRHALGFKEAVGVFVAFSVIGSILFWSFPKDQGDFDPGSFLGDPAPEVDEPPQALLPVPLPEEGPEVQERAAPRPPTSVPEQAVREPAQQVPAATPTPTVSFSDVSPDFWAYPFIAALAQRQIISGFEDGTFRSQNPVTRAEFAAMVQKAFGDSAAKGSVAYKDIPSGFWATSAIRQATQAGFLKGYPGQVFRPTQQIPRVQALVSLVSGLGLAAPEAGRSLLQQQFQDANQVPAWAVNPVAAATQAGLVVNHPNPNQLNPSRATTRAEAAALIYQALVQRQQAELVQSQYIVRP